MCAGWFNLLGQIAVTASVASCAMLVIVSMVLIVTDYALNQAQQLAVYAGARAVALLHLLLVT